MSTRLTGTIREKTRLTGSLGVATITTFGDATALASDITAGETAYIATGKVTGTSTLNADTSSATATASDILTGKTAYISDGTEATGTCDFNADTTDATATADSLLYGHTAYGAAGTKLTGTGAYWQNVYSMNSTFYGADLVGSIPIYAPLCTNLTSTFRGNANITSITFTFGAVSLIATAFNACTNLVSLIGTLDITPSTTGGTTMLANCPALVTVTFAPSCIKHSFILSASSFLSTSSLLSVANGLNAGTPATLTMHATSKTNMNNIMVDSVDGTAVLGSTMSLTTFITTIKGWTIA